MVDWPEAANNSGWVFRSGADKVSIGSDAVEAVIKLRAAGGIPSGDTSIETISWHYGAQAVVVSIDPRRVWVHDRTSCIHPCIRSHTTGVCLSSVICPLFLAPLLTYGVRALHPRSI